VGIEICYELRFPEVTRALALAGARVIALPTNWPTNAAMLADHVICTRASENRVFFVAANRTGSEQGTRFIGRSQIVDPSGHRLAELDGDAVGLVFVEIDVAEAEVKDLVVQPGEYEVSLFADRRPDLYGALTALAQEPSRSRR
jgi:predicted amidohydrolase